jgi:hypothetical protein
MIKEVSRSLGVGERDADGELGEVLGGGARSEVVDLVDRRECGRLADIHVLERETGMVTEMFDVLWATAAEVVETQNLVAVVEKRVTEVATDETTATSDKGYIGHKKYLQTEEYIDFDVSVLSATR